MDEPTIIFRVHAVQQMFRRGIAEVDVRTVLEEGQTIEEYPDDTPFPARLVLGFIDLIGTRAPIHVVASHDAASDTIFVVTVYEPDPKRWEPGFRRRKKP